MKGETFAGEPLDPYALKDEVRRLRAENEKICEQRDAARMGVIDVVRENEKLWEALDDLLHVSQNMECELQVGEIELSAPFKKAWLEAIRSAAAALKGEPDAK